jgi:ornithine--oxo-acid transaminase
MSDVMAIEANHCAAIHSPLQVVLTKGEGIYVYDQHGKCYLDMATGVSVLNFGHCHPRIIEALVKQANTLTATSRHFYHDKFAAFLQKACEVTGYDKAVCMNSGAEAVETAIKIARKWGYQSKQVEENAAEIIVCDGNFHGRTITTISMSSEPKYKDKFGPLTPGFKLIPYNDAQALEQAITANTVAFLVEPIQGESGVKIPDANYLKKCEQICHQHHLLLICDEIHAGLGRTGKVLACEHNDVKPDLVLLGKSLGGGILPVSLVLGKAEIMDVFQLGDHGSTFGGNPMASAVGLAALNVLIDEQLPQRAAENGDYFINKLREINSPLVKEIRGKGLFIGIEINTALMSSREICLKLLECGLLGINTRNTTVRLLPPLIINKLQIDAAVKIIENVLLIASTIPPMAGI